MEESIKIETIAGPRPTYKVSKEILGILRANLGGHFSHREENGIFIIKPNSARTFKYFADNLGAENFEYLKDE